MKKFQLVNPNITGTLKTNFEAKNTNDAAIKAYETISSVFSNNVPNFFFTLQNGGNFYHFNAQEKTNKDGKIKFTIKQSGGKVNTTSLKNFIKNSEKMNGGSKYRFNDDDSSSSSDDSSSEYNYFKPVHRPKAIDYWAYWGGYPQTQYYIPQFISTIRPYVYVTFNQ